MAFAALVLHAPLFAAEIATTVGSSKDAPDQEIHQEIGTLKDAVANPQVSNASIYEMAHDLFGRVPGTKINVDLNTRAWDVEREFHEDPADVARLNDTAAQRLAHYKSVPPPELVQAAGYASGMSESGKVAFDTEGKMDDHEMGVYEYIAHKSELGLIRLNQFMAFIAIKVGDAFAYSTLAHEAGHARDHQEGQLSPEEVVKGEIRAFQTQYQWLTVVDPYGERLSYLRAQLRFDAKLKPNKLNVMALNYADHLAEVRATGGDPDKIRKMVEKLGYQEGHGGHHGSMGS